MVYRIFLHFFALILCSFLTLTAEDSIRIETFRGKEITPHIDEIVNLWSKIYRDYPYLYDGEDAIYKAHLSGYAKLNDSIICVVFDNKKAVGLAIGIPLTQTREIYQEVFLEKGYELQSIFYLSEFGLQPDYRGKGVEEKMYQKIEDFVLQNGKFKMICFWEINNSLISPQKRSGYVPKEKFWNQLDFTRHKELSFHVHWTNINAKEKTPHLATYWIKIL
jgi:GNAT superfamily N-acetyltransferase